MTREMQVGTILMSQWPPPLLLEDGLQNNLERNSQKEHFSGNWSVVEATNGHKLDRDIREAGWNFFFIASEVKATFFGAIGTNKVRRALHRILDKVKEENFNGLEITGIVAKRFLGMSYAVVTAHSRHLQHNCYLDGAEARRASQPGTANT